MWRRGDGWRVNEWRVSNTCACYNVWHIVCAVGVEHVAFWRPQYVVLLTTRCKYAEKKSRKNCPQAGFEPSTSSASACEPSALPSEL